MPYQLVYADLSLQKGEAAVNPLSLNKQEQSRATRSLLQAANNQDYDDLLAKTAREADSCFLSSGYHSGFAKIINIVSPHRESDPSLNRLRMAYLRVINFALEQGIHELWIPLIGIDSDGYSEEESSEIGKSVVAEMGEHHKINLVLFLPLPGTETGFHQAETLKSSSRPLSIVLDESNIVSYWDYFIHYLNERKAKGYPIKGAQTEEEFGQLLFDNGLSSSQKSRWKTQQKNKDGSLYWPAPGKKVLFLIVLLLDMNYEEAKNCFSFCGYGLTPFDRVDNYYLDILKNPRPDLNTINEQLVKQFGPGASFWKFAD